MIAAMLEGWSDFFLMVGSSGAALIGLMFVVISLTAGRDNQAGIDLYTSPIVAHFGACFVISAAAMAHGIALWGFGVVVAAAGGLGILVAARVLVRMRSPDIPVPHWSDPWCYGVAPLVLYVALVVAGWLLAGDAAWAIGLTGALVILLLLVAIRNAWDLLTFLAPEHPPTES